jgi:hypothetical protein
MIRIKIKMGECKQCFCEQWSPASVYWTLYFDLLIVNDTELGGSDSRIYTCDDPTSQVYLERVWQCDCECFSNNFSC